MLCIPGRRHYIKTILCNATVPLPATLPATQKVSCPRCGESVPVREGELQLGTWQRVLFIELDRERDRRWLVQVVGNE